MPESPAVVAAVVEQYSPLLGRSIAELPTPLLLLHRDLVADNIAVMARRTSGRVDLRPNAKTHKSPEVARLQVAAGAVGVTTANAWETLAMARAGIDGVLLASPLADDEKLGALAEAAREREILVALDSAEAVDALASAAARAGSRIGALVDVDVNMHRLGVRSESDAVALAERILRAPGLRLRGLQGWEGHAVQVRAPRERAEVVRAARDVLANTRAAVENAGIKVGIVSGGGTTTQEVAVDELTLTEWQTGTYVFMDEAFRALAPSFVPGGITVLTTVISRHADLLILDAGKKEIGIEPWGGAVAKSVAATTADMHENHTLIRLNENSDVGFGDRVEVVPGHACTTVNLHDAYCVIEDGIVVDIWPILARGPGRATV